MWKALIKLVEKWSYRCDHNWEYLSKTNVYDEDDIDGLPLYRIRIYRCTKCCKFKKIKV